MHDERYGLCLVHAVWVAALLLSASALPAQELTGARYQISEAVIARELSAIVGVEASQVHLPVRMSATVVAPKLEVMAAEPVDKDQIRLKLRCPAVTECLPFLVTIDVKKADQVSAELRSKMAVASTADQPTLAQIGARPASRVGLKVGSRALLMIRDGHLDIRLQVLAMDSGGIGQQVRVCTLDRKKIFHATVIGEQTVTGVME